MLKTVGKLNGLDVIAATLQSGNSRVQILNYGCVIQRWQVNQNDKERDIVLGFKDVELYPEHSRSFGIIAGRVANRTRLGQFKLKDKTHQLSINNGPHHLHGGTTGLGRRLWSMDPDSSAQRVKLNYRSPAGEEGYPGNLDIGIEFHLNEKGLHCTMHAQPDEPTPVNLAQHNYYNLDGMGDIRRHSLFVDAAHYLPVDDELIPTGQILSVTDTRFDFQTPARIDQVDPGALGHDHNLVLRSDRRPDAVAATLASSDGSLQLDIVTDQPGIQLYTAEGLSVDVAGFNGTQYGKFGGICLETQYYPDSLNQPTFPAIVCTPDNPYQQSLSMLLRS